MSPSSLRIIIVVFLIGLAPLAISCGHDASFSGDEAEDVAGRIRDGFVQADLAPVEEVQAEAVADEEKAADDATAEDDAADDGSADDVACDPADEGCEEELEDVDVTPA